MIAIHTKYLGPTDTKGSRIQAYTCGSNGFKVTIPYNRDVGTIEAHFEAVKALKLKHNLEWDLSNMRYGDSADGRGYSFCFDASKV